MWRNLFKSKYIVATASVLTVFLLFTRTLVPSLPKSCDYAAQVRVLGGYGKVFVSYSNLFRESWSVSFTSHKSTGYEFTVRESGPELCAVLDSVYDRAMQLPMTARKE